jgi:uncharacterized protein YjgD (DUF1641 family)
MRELIKKILKEYVEPEISIEIVENVYEYLDYEILNETIDRAKYYNDKTTIEDYLKTINPLTGCYIDNRTKNEVCKKIDINVTGHFIERLQRTNDPMYRDNTKIENPETFEGIDLVIKNIDKIVKTINVNNNPKFGLLLKRRDFGKSFDIGSEVKKQPKKSIELLLTTQLKGSGGTELKPKNDTITIKLH